MSSYIKTLVRTIKNHTGRFLALTGIITLGICFVSGLGIITPKILDTVSDQIMEAKTADIIVKSTNPTGFLENDIKLVEESEGVQTVKAVKCFETNIGDLNSRFYIMNLENQTVNKISLIEGTFPIGVDECVVERASNTVKEFAVGQTIEYMNSSIKITGIVKNPLILAKDGERDMINDEKLDLIAYFTTFAFSLPTTDLFIKVKNVETFSIFSKSYKDKVDECKQSLNNIDVIKSDGKVLTLQENRSVATIKGLADKVDIICVIFPIFFILVVGLVSLTTMTRLIEEERASIACYKTLGFSNTQICFKYLFFASICCIVGVLIGLGAGVFVLPSIVCPAFNSLIFMESLSPLIDLSMGVIAGCAMILSVLAVTAIAVSKNLKEKPAELLVAKCPKVGKKIFLENISFIWKRMKFKYKSTWRNIFRYVGKLVMTITSVAGSTALVIAGFGLYDFSTSEDIKSGIFSSMSNSLTLISLVIVLFAVALCTLVLYNLANMIIGERKREIATLMVLGYSDNEVIGYIFRDIFIMSVMGILIGLPFGILLIHFVFTFLDFGSLSSVNWYSFILAGMIVIFTTGIVALLLRRKILSINMNASLKTVE